jgi:hypothetical protein
MLPPSLTQVYLRRKAKLRGTSSEGKQDERTRTSGTTPFDKLRVSGWDKFRLFRYQANKETSFDKLHPFFFAYAGIFSQKN